MTIVLCGSGSGGHITPLVAVAKAIKEKSPETRLVFIGEINGKFNDVIRYSRLFDEELFISTGKFRRYHNEPFIRRITDIKTIALNIRDLFKITNGVFQGRRLIHKLKADAVFLKGGSVCIPAGLGAKFAGVVTVTHDSDAVPGISNRIGGKHAVYHTTGMPESYYNFASGQTVYVGLPISKDFRLFNNDEAQNIKLNLGIAATAPTLLITGGSQGASRLNNWCAEVLPKLLQDNPELFVIFVTGKNKEVQINNPRVRVIDFTNEMYNLAAASDLIIARAGATTVAEFATMKKALILVPNPDLAGGHQLKNAKVFKDSESVIIVDEAQIKVNPDLLRASVQKLIDDQALRFKLAENLFRTVPERPAAEAIAELLLAGNRGNV